MTRIEKILKMARITLADKEGQRWDDEDLVAILNEGQIDFAKETRMLHEHIDVPIIIGEAYFELPEDCWLLTRALYDGSPIPLVTHHELDVSGGSRRSDFGIAIGDKWEQATGEPAAIIYDRVDMLQGKIYPIPDEPLSETDYTFIGSVTETFYVQPDNAIYGIVTATEGIDMDLIGTYGVLSSLASLTDDVVLTPDYGVQSAITMADELSMSAEGLGVVVDITGYDMGEAFGILVDLEASDIATEVFEDVFGLVETIVESSSCITMYYLRNPTAIEDVNSVISLPAMYDIALKFYVCGQAFLNDIDAAYQQKGAAQMMQYERHLKGAKKDSLRDFTQAGQYKTTYRSAF
jgi:hypothetical protein